jgi:predicted AAA+ superfamily ATPase
MLEGSAARRAAARSAVDCSSREQRQECPPTGGKTTLARTVGDARGYDYKSFDDDVLRAGAQADPVSFVADLTGPVVLDEVQRVPSLFAALKQAVDRRREPGRFLLTGSMAASTRAQSCADR